MLQQQLAEMGTAQGHIRQDALLTRLAVAVAAPWQGLPQVTDNGVKAMDVEGDHKPADSSPEERQYSAAAAQADIMVEYVWHIVFESGATSTKVLDIKCVRSLAGVFREIRESYVSDDFGRVACLGAGELFCSMCWFRCCGWLQRGTAERPLQRACQPCLQ